MIPLVIPGRPPIELHHAVFDINGTLAVDGLLSQEVLDRLQALSAQLRLHALTAGTHGNLATIEQALGFPFRQISTRKEKAAYVQQLQPERVIAFGNGVNDVEMLRLAVIGVAVLGAEGVAAQTLQVADVVALGPLDAIDLLLNPKRLVATLRA